LPVLNLFFQSAAGIFFGGSPPEFNFARHEDRMTPPSVWGGLAKTYEFRQIKRKGQQILR
jgi:hypothetical protein